MVSRLQPRFLFANLTLSKRSLSPILKPIYSLKIKLLFYFLTEGVHTGVHTWLLNNKKIWGGGGGGGECIYVDDFFFHFLLFGIIFCCSAGSAMNAYGV